MAHLGDFDTSTVVYGKFTTYRPSTGATHTLAGTPALSVYKDNSTTQSTTGVTLTADFDSVTGLNHFAIDTSADGTFYSAGSFFDIVITTGTVDSVSVTGSVVGSFTLRKNSALKPTTAARTLDVSAGGEAGIDWANIGSPTTAQNLSGTNIDTDQVVASVSGAVGSVTGNVGGSVASIATGGISEASFATTAGSFYPLGYLDQGTAQSATATTLVLRAAAGFADDELIGATIVITGGSAGVGQARTITDYVGATDTATVDTWTTTPTGTITYKIAATAAGAGGSAPTAAQIADAVWDEAQADHVAAGSFGEVATEVAAILVDTGTTLDGKIDTIDNFLDTEMAAVLAAVDTEVASIKAVTDLLPDAGALTSLATQASVNTIDDFLDTEIAAIKAKTDSLTFTTAGIVDANVQQINDVTITGDGQTGTEFNVA